MYHGDIYYHNEAITQKIINVYKSNECQLAENVTSKSSPTDGSMILVASRQVLLKRTFASNNEANTSNNGPSGPSPISSHTRSKVTKILFSMATLKGVNSKNNMDKVSTNSTPNSYTAAAGGAENIKKKSSRITNFFPSQALSVSIDSPPRVIFVHAEVHATANAMSTPNASPTSWTEDITPIIGLPNMTIPTLTSPTTSTTSDRVTTPPEPVLVNNPCLALPSHEQVLYSNEDTVIPTEPEMTNITNISPSPIAPQDATLPQANSINAASKVTPNDSQSSVDSPPRAIITKTQVKLRIHALSPAQTSHLHK